MVLAAGVGSRLKPFSDIVPKPLMPVLGVPSMEYALLSLRNAGVNAVIANVHAHAGQMRKYFQSQPVPNLTIQESDEELKLLGSSGGFRKALPFFQGQSFFAMNADVIHLANLAELAVKHAELKKKYGVQMTLILAKGKAVDAQTGSYREIYRDDKSGLIMGFGEKRSNVPFYTGTGIFEEGAFQALPLNEPSEFVPQVLEPLIQARKVGFIESDALFVDIGSPELWAQAQGILKSALDQGELPDFLAERISRADPSVGGTFELGKNKIRLQDIEYEIKDLRYL